MQYGRCTRRNFKRQHCTFIELIQLAKNILNNVTCHLHPLKFTLNAHNNVFRTTIPSTRILHYCTVEIDKDTIQENLARAVESNSD